MALRLAFLCVSPSREWPHSIFFEGDSRYWGLQLSEGAAFQFGLPMRAPGVYLLLASVQSLVGSARILCAKLLWSAMFGATTFGLFRLVESFDGARSAQVAACLFAFAFGSNALVDGLGAEQPYQLLLVLLSLSLIDANPSVRRSLAEGVLHGLGLLLRSEHALVLVGSLCLRAIRGHSSATRPSASHVSRCVMTFVVCALVAAPQHVSAVGAIEDFNSTELSTSIEPNGTAQPFSPDGEAFLASLPAFARGNTRDYLAWKLSSADSAPGPIDGEVARRVLMDDFGYIPAPLRVNWLMPRRGGLDFALANQVSGTGGFDRSLLDSVPGGSAEFSFTNPAHLRLYDEGFSVGLRGIADAPAHWVGLVRRKLWRYLGGVDGGFTLWNLPYGPWSVRHPVDMAVSRNRGTRVWSLFCVALIVAGLARHIRRFGWSSPIVMILGCSLLTTVFFYGYARSGFVVYPFYLVLAMGGAKALLGRWAPRNARSVGGLLVVALMLAELCALIAVFRGVRLRVAELGAPAQVTVESQPVYSFAPMEIEYGVSDL